MKLFNLAKTIFCITMYISMINPAFSQTEHPRELFNEILNAHVVDGQVNYDAIEPEKLQPYIDYIANLEVNSLNSDKEKLIFYINAYNALSIKGILDGKSPKTLVGRYKFFKSVKYQIAQQEMNLYDFEHEIIRPLGEPRIHFALVCASFSCPKLRSEIYRVETLETQLNENAIDFLNDTTKNKFDLEKNKAKISKIFDWFTEDFTATGKTLQEYLSTYVENPEISSRLNNNEFKIKQQKYNWRLNGTFDKKAKADESN